MTYEATGNQSPATNIDSVIFANCCGYCLDKVPQSVISR